MRIISFEFFVSFLDFARICSSFCDENRDRRAVILRDSLSIDPIFVCADQSIECDYVVDNVELTRDKRRNKFTVNERKAIA